MSISGRDALHQIDRWIKQTRDAVNLATEELSDAEQELAALRSEEARISRDIARIRIDSLGKGEAGVDALEKIDRKALALLEQHDTHIAGLEGKLAEADATVEKLEADRLAQEDALGEAIANHEAAAEETRKRLDRDNQYQTLAATLEKANAVVDHAASKLKIAEQDRREKGEPYEDDPLFSYLRERKFATKDYRAFPLFAIIDRWVAGLINYRDARLNYERLLEIPERLREHLDWCEEKAASLADDVEAYERRALEEDGVEKLRTRVEKARAALEALDEDLAAAEKDHHAAVEALTKANDGKHGPLYEACLLIEDVLKDKSIPDLKLLAAETLTPEDDALVERLAGIRLDRFAAEDAGKAARQSLERSRVSLSELEKLRRRFKQARFDSHQSEFHSAEMISLLLADFTRGTLGPAEVWRRLEKSHRVRRRDWHDDFGGEEWRDGFGLPPRRSRPTHTGGGGVDWSRVGRDVASEIERELGRALGGGLGGSIGGSWGGGYNPGKTRKRYRPRRRPRTITRSAPRIRVPRRGGGGFRTGGGF